MTLYLNDNRQTFPRLGLNNKNLGGNWAQATSSDQWSMMDMWGLYTNELQGNIGTFTYFPNSTSPTAIQSQGIAVTPLKVLLCPSNPVSKHYNFFAGSTNDKRVTLTSLLAAAKAEQKFCGLNPALIADRVQVAIAGGQSAGTESNHWDYANQTAAGGNVASVDGSVQWCPLDVVDVGNFHVMPYGGPSSFNNQVATPGNAIFMVTEGTGNFNNAAWTLPKVGTVVIGTSFLNGVQPPQNPFN